MTPHCRSTSTTAAERRSVSPYYWLVARSERNLPRLFFFSDGGALVGAVEGACGAVGGFALSGAAPLKCTTSLDFFGGWLDDVFETVFARGSSQRAVEAGREQGLGADLQRACA